ncbi:MAG: nicotinate-nucleotide adenylyltransferase [Acidobacteriota bacterium]
MNDRRIGAYGGTFDPVHNGHIEVARAVTKEFELDELLLIPAHRPPHKGASSISNSYHRYAMAVLATLDEPRVSVSTIELKAPNKPYSFETVERLKQACGPQTELFFVVGADSFEEINTWREPQRLLASSNLIAVTRPGYEVRVSHLPDLRQASIVDVRGRVPLSRGQAGSPRIYLTDCVNNDVSSTEIRRRVRAGESIDGLAPSSVVNYIEKYELYRR